MALLGIHYLIYNHNYTISVIGFEMCTEVISRSGVLILHKIENNWAVKDEYYLLVKNIRDLDIPVEGYYEMKRLVLDVDHKQVI